MYVVGTSLLAMLQEHQLICHHLPVIAACRQADSRIQKETMNAKYYC